MRHLVLILFFALLCAPAAALASVLDIKEVKSESGITAWLVEDHSVPVIAMEIAFRGAGAVLDPAEKQGLSRLVANTMDEGAGDLDSQAFQKTLQDLSITLHFGSDRDHFGGSLKTLTSNSEKAFELFALALTRPRFDPEPVTRMREANKARIRSSLSDPEWMAARLLNARVFEGHPYAQNSGGTLSGLDAITEKDLRAFHRTRLAKDNLVVAVAGDIKAAELKILLDKVFSDLPDNAVLPQTQDITVQNSGEIALYEQDIPQVVLQMMQPGIKREDPDYHTLQVMNFILGSSGFGSRLMEEIREKRGLTYGIYSYTMDLDHFAGLGVSTSTANENAAEMIRLISEEWNRMTTQPVSEQELKSAKTYLIGSLPLSLTSTDKIASLLVSLMADGLPIDYLDRREKAINALTAADIETLAKNVLDTKALSLVMVGKPQGFDDPELKTLRVERLPDVE